MLCTLAFLWPNCSCAFGVWFVRCNIFASSYVLSFVHLLCLALAILDSAAHLLQKIAAITLSPNFGSGNIAKRREASEALCLAIRALEHTGLVLTYLVGVVSKLGRFMPQSLEHAGFEQNVVGSV